MQRDLFMERREWLLRRHRALSPRQMALAYGVLCMVSLSVAGGFLLLGVWQILFFSALEMSAVGAAFLHYARHAADHDHLILSCGSLLVASRRGRVLRQLHLDPGATRVTSPATPRAPIVLSARGVRIEVGALATPARRLQTARELRAALAEGWCAP
ncbi:DUF2244 domain-containing protein [Rugamonas sp.]|uniref:DUF2244 domain-containing protein n=1 Tax=Rugamonas sp. TaxID=1926287 RepID=UPI0025DE2A6B|nr:DUF2244 domain-containing protein [Rugamonas sp.]